MRTKPTNQQARCWRTYGHPIGVPASLSAPYHSVASLHEALLATAARSRGILAFEWLHSDVGSQVEGTSDEPAVQLALLRTQSVQGIEPPPLRAVVLFGEHAREAITSEVALRFAALLAGEPSSGDAELRQRAAALRRRVEFAMLPLVNVRGRELFERGDVRHQARRTPAELLGAAL